MPQGHRNYGNAVRERDALMAMAQKVFREDKAMIEAQQQIIDTTPPWRVIPTKNDRDVMLFNQLIEELAGEESTRVSG